MTQSKREPFAYVTECFDLVVGGRNIKTYFRKHSAVFQAKKINAAFNARVDEEVKVALAHQEMELFSEKKIAEAIEKAVARAVAERDARIKGLETELLESSRLHGMGSQREAALKARIAELEKVLVGASEYIEGLAKRTGVLHGNIPEIRKALGKGER